MDTPRDAPRAEQNVEAMLLHAAYDRLPLSLLMTAAATLIFVGMLWQFFPTARMTVWAVAILTIVALRYLLWTLFQRATPESDALALWRNLFLIGSAAAGAAWALGPILMMPPSGSAASALFVGTLLSVCAVAISTQGSQQAAMQVFVISALVPSAIAIWRTGGDVERVTAVVLMAGLVSMIVAGLRSSKAMREVLETQSRIRDIQNKLQDQNDELLMNEESLRVQIEEYESAQKLLKESEDRFRSYTVNSPHAIFVCDENGHYLDVNPASCSLTGYTSEELLTMSIPELLPPESLEWAANSFQALLETGQTRGEAAFRRKNGTIGYWSLDGAKISSTRFIGFVIDITERKKTEAILQDIIDKNPMSIQILNKEGFTLAVNPAHTKLFGAVPPTDYCIFTDPQLWQQGLSELLLRGKNGEVVQFPEFSYNAHDFRSEFPDMPVWIRMLIFPLKGSDGTIERFVLMHDNYTERKRAEDALLALKDTLQEQNEQLMISGDKLRESESYYRLLTEDASDVVWRVDSNNRFTYISPADERLRGYRADEVIGHHVFELFTDEGISVVKEKMRKRLEAEHSGTKTGTETFEVEHKCKDGSLLWAEISSTPERDSEGNIIGYHGITREITERKEHEKELLKIEKLESLGILAGGIAHDFNNILTGIMGNISFALMFLDPTHKSYKRLTEAEKASVRAGELAQQLLTFARGGEPVKKVISVKQLMHESVSLVLSGSNVKGILDINDSLQAIEADEGQLSQVFHNIIINATQAMPGGGTVTVTARNENLAIKNTPALPVGNYVRISFEDNGCGISADNLKKIFDPYFTTKSAGNGLGLASVHSIINRHGGSINATSTIGKGTTFTLYLPSTGAVGTGDQADSPTINAGAHLGGSILVMDDEEIIRELTTEILEYMGHHVKTCVEGMEAVTLYKAAMESGNPFAAVIMDLTIPAGMGGNEAAQQILAIDPTACLIVSSGYSNDPIMADYAKYGFSAAVAKPYSMSEFSRLLGSLGGLR